MAMSNSTSYLINLCLAVAAFLPQGKIAIAKDVQRPEQIVSMRQVYYDDATYKKLESLWEEYYHEFPSEDAYANWMYAARYAGDENYLKLLDRGLKKYSANPKLLYLKAMTTCGTHNDTQAQSLLERAVQLDPSYNDPWFGLIGIYMDRNDEERTDIALRHLLENDAIAEEVMDYNYNMLSGLGKEAILITNGDNDTYPGWILTRILKHRPDVTIVNRSLLNTDWYPIYLIDHGLPKFITKSALEEFRENIMEEYRSKGTPIPYGGPFGDTLIVRLIESAEQVGRPVYFSWTLYHTPTIKRYLDTGLPLALVTLVTPQTKPVAAEVKNAISVWLNDFRTGGLDTWRLHYAKGTDSGKMLMPNYAGGIMMLIENIKKYVPEDRLDLFRWYQKHLTGLLNDQMTDAANKMWCEQKDIQEIQTWCQSQGYIE
jgi:tetratricopeptide (TPR) repeat protein